MNTSRRLSASIVTLGILMVTIPPVGRSDPPLGGASGCAAATAEQAKSLADQLYRQGQYQHAGECYQAAGDLADANEAFVKAVRPNSNAAAEDLKRQSQAAKTFFTSVQQALRSNH